MAEDTSTFTTKKQGMASSDEFKWGEGGSSWEEEINESNGFGMKNGNVTIARPPEAAVSVDVSTGDLDTTFSFDATGTTDPTDTSISYEWAFGDGTTKSGAGDTVSHSFSTVDSFTVTVTATNEYGNTDTASVTVTVESRPPTASFTADQTTGNTDTTFSFDASGSTDPDGEALAYTWNFGDGATETGETTPHSFSEPGDYTVELIVEDEYGNTDTTTTPVTVNSRAPDASFTVSPSTGDADTSFSFDGSGSSDPDGSTITYEWTFGDGATATGETTPHSYATPGTYTAELTVTDAYGNSDIATTSITVESRNPDASFTTDSTTGNADTTFAFDGAGSSDPDGSTLTYEWAFGDGATTTGETTSHSYADPGDYTVELTVTDEYGNTDTATSTITVTSRTPDASFTVDPSTGTADTSFSFDGSSSSDPDGSMLTYEWDFGDGATATGATTSHSYGTPDVYTVTLTVTDEYGASASTSKTVEVNDLPSASFTYSPSDPTTDDTISFDGSGSSDSDGTISSYAWDFGDGATATGKTVSHQYADSATYTVELTVTDDDGDSDSTTRNLSVEAGGERTSGMSQYIHEDPEASTSFSTNSNNWQYDIDLDGTGGGGEIMVGTTGGQIDLSDVETVYVDWMLDYGGRGAVNIGIDSTLSNIHDENVDGGNLDASYQHKNSSSFSRRTDSLNTSGISGTRHIGVGLQASSSGSYDHRLYVYSIWGVDSNGNTVFTIVIPDSIN
ncbi:PKD domain-containing protein [Halorubrum lacusprofundi]|jgi:PKD repeat protein|uniref:PKD domain containing protein n=1 Tax=Halorubrum lacusprofundi (strain ATCC 49239 / DSM 5036 / JCM 8891 / ACAM 34) TaxID=416348 RepID=B9LW00_HALLT|nr:PKD domain-containing protein [Halorubrum lacusprofundi]ACM58390.1 PKD domain containing protein [Halorubrum lacusprofundi ATCC 49239]